MSFNLDDYEPVAVRIGRFWQDHPDGQLHTEIVFDDGSRIVVKATVYVGQLPIATDYAEEHLTDRGVNATSRIENCCTSAVGRALALAGYASTDWQKKASREEMAKVQRMSGGAAVQQGNAGSAQPASPAQIGKIRAELKRLGFTTQTALNMAGKERLEDLTKREASTIIEDLIGMQPNTEEPF